MRTFFPRTLVALAACVALACGGREQVRAPEPAMSPSSKAAAPVSPAAPRNPPKVALTPPRTQGLPGWDEIKKLEGEQKYEAAAQAAGKRLDGYRNSTDAKEWTRALVRVVQLRTALHGPETAVRFLRDEPWPQDPLSQTVLSLFEAQTLVVYQSVYGWEIGQREQVGSTGAVDLRAMTTADLNAAITSLYAELWSRREQLGDRKVEAISEYLQPGTYPPGIRDTVRDAISYLWAESLVDSARWSATQQNEVFALELSALLSGSPGAKLDDPALHPLARIAAILSDLEQWHAGRGERDAALEAKLAALRALSAHLSRDDQRAAIRGQLVERLAKDRKLAWWSMGMADLAQMHEQVQDLVAARDAAREGADGKDPGAQKCRAIQVQLEAPDYQLAAITSDSAKQRSIEVTHKNLSKLYFRAYAQDLEQILGTARDWNLLPNTREAQALLSQRKPTVEWIAELPATPDLQLHKTFVVPPLSKPGLYTILASTRPEFTDAKNLVFGANLILSRWVLAAAPDRDGSIEVRVFDGGSGAWVQGAEVQLWKYDWQRGHQRIATSSSDPSGRATLSRAKKDGGSFFVVAKKDGELAVEASGIAFYGEPPPREQRGALVYTDRSIYRPGQKVLWKVVAYAGRAKEGKLAVQPRREVTVALVDPNGEKVETKTLTTNGFGSASGEFTVPTGRLLGGWQLSAQISGTDAGRASLQVEEYKRPTFEVKVEEPKEALRLNREAVLSGEARYYFGQPLTSGKVRWRVERVPVFPWWWGIIRPGPNVRAEQVAGGTSALSDAGRFEVRFTPKADEEIADAKSVSYRYRLAADVTDEGGETRSGERIFRLGFVAIEALIEPEQGFLSANQPGAVKVTRLDLDGSPRAGKGRWKLVRLAEPERALLPAEEPRPLPEPQKPGAFLTEGDRQSPRWFDDYKPERTLSSWKDGAEVSHGEAAHDAKGLATVSLPALPAGTYRLRYSTEDAFGATFEATRELLVAGEGYAPKLPLELVLAKSSVKVGETARIYVRSGLPDPKVLFELFRGGQRIETRELSTAEQGGVISLPIRAEHRGGLGIRVTTVRDHQPISLQQDLLVPWDDKQLTLEFSTFRDQLRPGAKETFTVLVKDPAGKPVEARAAEVLAYMFDQSLDLFGPHSPPSVPGLYPSRAGVPALETSVKQGGAFWVFSRDFPPTLPWPDLRGDELKFFAGYPIGGLGRGGRVVTLGRGYGRTSAEALSAPRAAPGGGKAKRSVEGLAQADNRSAAPPAAAEPLRTQFAETAFWQPHLLTSADGTVKIEFTVPDSVTGWHVWAHAITSDLRGGEVSRDTRSAKELMVRPYVPRFLREGDRAELQVVVNNTSPRALEGTLDFDLVDPDTRASVASEFGLQPAPKSFRIEAGKSTTLSYALTAPKKVFTAAVKAVAKAGELSDGELRPFPVLPSRVHLQQSRFVTFQGPRAKTLSFPDLAKNDDPTRVNEQLVVTVDAQLFYTALRALPALVNYPYECTEQTLNRFVSTGIVSRVFGDYPAVAKMAAELAKRETPRPAWDAVDPNRKMTLEESPWLVESRGGKDEGLGFVQVLDPKTALAERAASLDKLRKAQTANGGFPWFPGGPPSPFMTLYILHGLSRAAEYGVDVPKDVTARAWQYLASQFRENSAALIAKDEGAFEWLTFLNYVASAYPDESYTGGGLTDAERKRILDYSFRHWKEHSPYLKAYLALTLKRMGRPADAKLVWDSVMDSAKTTPELGTYWAPEERAWLWYNDTIETHAFALTTLTELSPKDPRRAGLVQWLLLNKKLNAWKSTRATAEVIYALVKYLEQEGALGVREVMTIDAPPEKRVVAFEPDKYQGKAQLVVPGERIDPSRTSTVTVTKEGKGVAFASATWSFSTDQLPTEARGDFFEVTRRYFKRDTSGKEPKLTPLAEGAPIAVGDQLEVQLSLKVKHAAEYVHLRDPRAAGFEPENPVSHYVWELGVGRYEEVRDSGTNFFFDWLPAGEYPLKYRLRANMAGTFRIGPATVQSMYAPEFNAYSAGNTLGIAPAAK